MPHATWLSTMWQGHWRIEKCKTFKGAVGFFIRIFRQLRINCLGSLIERLDTFQKMSCRVSCSPCSKAFCLISTDQLVEQNQLSHLKKKTYLNMTQSCRWVILYIYLHPTSPPKRKLASSVCGELNFCIGSLVSSPETTSCKELGVRQENPHNVIFRLWSYGSEYACSRISHFWLKHLPSSISPNCMCLSSVPIKPASLKYMEGKEQKSFQGSIRFIF